MSDKNFIFEIKPVIHIKEPKCEFCDKTLSRKVSDLFICDAGACWDKLEQRTFPNIKQKHKFLP